MAIRVKPSGGTQQVIPNAKEVLSKIKSVAYCSTNPPPYPVTSVNGKTGAVTLTPIYEHTYYVTGTAKGSSYSFTIDAYIKVINTNSPGASFSASYLSECPVQCTGHLHSTNSMSVSLDSLQILSPTIRYSGTRLDTSDKVWVNLSIYFSSWSSPLTGTWISSVQTGVR